MLTQSLKLLKDLNTVISHLKKVVNALAVHAMSSETTWYCFTGKLFCHPDCMHDLQEKLITNPKGPNDMIVKVETDDKN